MSDDDPLGPGGCVVTTRIPLRGRDGTVRGYAIVDDADARWLSAWRWRIGTAGYAMRTVHLEPSKHGRKRGTILMHREILALAPGDPRQGDHINRNRLDNRRANLRIVSHRQQHQNRSADRGTTSSHRGVYWHTSNGRWAAQVILDGRHHWLGYFDSEEEAARVASVWRAEHMPFSVEEPAA